MMGSCVLSVWVVLVLWVSAAYTSTYPNPMLGGPGCGHKTSSYICDPKNILETAQVDELDRIVASLKETTQCLCHHSENCDHHTDHLVLVAVEDSVHFTSGGPQYNVDVFAEQLYTKWTTDSRKCKMVVVIVYNAHYKVVGINMNKFGKRVLTNLDKTIVTATDEFFKQDKTFEGLQEIVNYCKYALYRGIAPREFSLWTALGLPIVVSIPIVVICSLCWIYILTCRK